MENYGKFSSAEELLKGYNELEKSFTQKCQQLAALQKQNNSDGTNEQSSPSQQPELQSDLSKPDINSDANTAAQLTEDNGAAAEVTVDCAVPADVDAKSAATDSPSPRVSPLPKVMASGGNVSLTLPSKPKTIKEASILAKKLFEK